MIRKQATWIVWAAAAAVAAGCAAAAAVAAGCAAAEPNGSAVVNDSAGIRIVLSTTPEWEVSRQPRWRIRDEPSVIIGQQPGDSLYELHGVTSAALLADGGVALTLGSVAQVRVYDRGGVFIRRFGGKGGGPGEMSAATTVRQLGDGSFIVWDAVGGLVSRFDSLGTFIAAGRVPSGSSFSGTFLAGVMTDGTIVHRVSSRATPASDGTYREPQALTRFRIAEGVQDTLVYLAGRELYHSTFDGVRGRRLIIFGRSGFAAVRSATVVYGDNDRFELFVADPDGRIREIYRKRHTSVKVSRRTAERERSAILAAISPAAPPELRIYQERSVAALPARETLPAFGRILTDTDDNIWVEVAGFGDSADVWHVFGSAGSWLGDVEMPAGVEVLHIGASAVLFKGRDEWDVEYVAVHPLLK